MRKQAFDTKVTFPLHFLDDDVCEHTKILKFHVPPGKGRDIIVGMPSLITDIGTLFVGLVQKAVNKFGGAQAYVVAVVYDGLGGRADMRRAVYAGAKVSAQIKTTYVARNRSRTCTFVW